MKHKKEILAIIPARAGTKGIPRKNIKMLCGKPLIQYSIEASLAAKSITRTIVSTDDQEMAEISRKLGAEVPFMRPAKHATDEASSLSVVTHALQTLKMIENYAPYAAAILPPTSPLRKAIQIDDCLSLLLQSRHDSVVTITEVKNHPYFMFYMKKNNCIQEFIKMDAKPLRRQELPKLYSISQAVCASRLSYLSKCADPSPLVNFSSITGYLIDSHSALDIDDFDDFALAEALLQQQIERYR